MTINKALSTITQIIANSIEEYDQSPDSKTTDAQGAEVRMPHALDIIDEGDMLFTLDMSLKDVALKATPISLLETSGSTASELKRVSTDYFIRVPTEPTIGDNLDIDDGLSYAVVFKALALLWREYGDYNQRADSIVNTYIQAYREYLVNFIAGNVGVGAETYIRFSADGILWHDSFTNGDTYISFKRIDIDSWTPAIQFVGTDGQDGEDATSATFTDLQDTPTAYTGLGGKVAKVKTDESGIEFVDESGGGGASAFIDLSDTPSTFTADKYIKVNSAGDALEFVDTPSGGGLAGANAFGDKIHFDDACSGAYELDAENNNVFYLYPTANIDLTFKQFTDDGSTVSALWGTTYTFMLASSANTAITFNGAESIFGDKTVELGSASSSTLVTMTILKMIYSGYDWYVVSRTVLLDSNG